jgi:hypothetical protein
MHLAREAFRAALNNACAGMNEAARLSSEFFTADEVKAVRRELARLMEIIDSQVLDRLKTSQAQYSEPCLASSSRHWCAARR